MKNNNFLTLLDTTSDKLDELCKNINNSYLSYPIKKRSGKYRWIDAPQAPLIDMQHAILYNIIYKFKTHEACIGFTKNKSVVDGAEAHLGSNILLTMDLRNFFNSIKLRRVYDTINRIRVRLNSKGHKGIKYSISTRQAQAVAALICFKGQLPQGAPSSPAMANLVAYPLDVHLSKFAKEHGVTYTRYADDIAFSHIDKDYNIGGLIKPIEAIVKLNKLRLNYKKTKIRRPHNRMSVTGIVINEKLSVPRWKWRNFRAELHNLITKGAEIELEHYQQLRGYAEWIKTLNPSRGKFFLSQIGKLQYMSS
jgi:retron-type reverse transcriptase